jgi:hypothetical protein
MNYYIFFFLVILEVYTRKVISYNKYMPKIKNPLAGIRHILTYTYQYTPEYNAIIKNKKLYYLINVFFFN